MVIILLKKHHTNKQTKPQKLNQPTKHKPNNNPWQTFHNKTAVEEFTI